MGKLNVTIRVLGSRGNDYEIKLFERAGKTKIRCGCPATGFCRHLRAVLQADMRIFDVPGNTPIEWRLMQDALDSTGLRAELMGLDARRVEIEAEIAKLTEELRRAKSRLADACEGEKVHGQ